MRAHIALGCGLAILAPATAGAATGDPAANRTLSQATLNACRADPSGQACETAALADLDAARATEGIGPMQLPGDFGSLTIPQQLLVLSNLERVDRGLVAVIGLSAALDQDALTGAKNDADPQPSQFNGNSATSNWEGGYGAPFEADFVWMYDDGPGSANLDCTAPGDSGCWGHRHDILAAFASPLVMGAANATGQLGASETELFVGGDGQTASGQADAPEAPTWARIAATLPFTVSPTTVSLAPSATSASVTVAASGENAAVTGSLPAAADGWSVTPATCTVNAGSSCTFILTAAPAATGTATTLTLQGPNGARQVALAKRGAAALRTSSRNRTITEGASTSITGTLLRPAGAGAPGLAVALTQQVAGTATTTTVAHGTTTATGAVSFPVSPRANTTYQVLFAGTATLIEASGAPTRIDVAPRITAGFVRRSVRAGSTTRLGGRVIPVPGRRVLALEVRRGRRWMAIASTRADRAGRYHFAVHPRNQGATIYRVMEPATATHARGLSPDRVLHAR